MVNKISSKIKKELLYWLSQKRSQKKITLKNIDKISNNFIKSLKNKCKKTIWEKRNKSIKLL